MKETMYERIRRIRKEKNISQEELARKSGYSSKSAISRIEKGERNLTADKIQSIARALNVSPSYLMDGEKSTLPKEITPTDEQKIYDLIQKIPEEDKDTVIRLIQGLIDNRDKK